MRKKLVVSIVGTIIALLSATTALAAPTNSNKANNNNQVVAYYDSGIHAIPANPIFYVEGTDLVMSRGNSGQIQQWFTDASGHGIHSVWNISKDGECNAKEVLITDAYPIWGDYLVPGADYCVQNNSF